MSESNHNDEPAAAAASSSFSRTSSPPPPQLSKIPLHSRISSFACNTLQSVVTYAHINSCAREILVDFGVAEVLLQQLADAGNKHFSEVQIRSFWRAASRMLVKQETATESDDAAAKPFCDVLIAGLERAIDKALAEFTQSPHKYLSQQHRLAQQLGQMDVVFRRHEPLRDTMQEVPETAGTEPESHTNRVYHRASSFVTQLNLTSCKESTAALMQQNEKEKKSVVVARLQLDLARLPPTLTHFSLWHCSDMFRGEGAKEPHNLWQQLMAVRLPLLEFLRVTWNGMQGVVSCKEIADAFPRLKTCYLGSNKLTCYDEGLLLRDLPVGICTFSVIDNPNMTGTVHEQGAPETLKEVITVATKLVHEKK